MSPRERQPLPPPVPDPEKTQEGEPDFSDPKERYRQRIDAALERMDKEDLAVEVKRLEDEMGVKLEDLEGKK